MSEEFDLVLARKETVADGVVRLVLAPLAGQPLPAWEPGAHIDLVLKPDLVRQYSLCGDPADVDGYRVAVLREPGGRGGSVHVHDELAPGDKVRVRGPRNNFSLARKARYIFVAGGIGITPLLPMIASAHAEKADWQLFYGGRTRASMAFRIELSALYGKRVTLRPQDEVGLLDLAAIFADPDRPIDAHTAVYCCGPEPLLAAVEAFAADWPAGTLHVERFAPRVATADDRPTGEFEVELARSGRTVRIPAERSILSVLEEAGVPVLSSCQEGTCGTCETVVLDGEPDHRDSLLTDEERAAGDTMMICVSRAGSARLVLDL